MNIPILVETRKAVLEGEIASLGSLPEDSGYACGYSAGARVALEWILNGGPSPSQQLKEGV